MSLIAVPINLPHYQLHLDISKDWRVLDLAVVRSALLTIESATVDVSWEEIGLLLAADALEPDLVAILSLPLTDPDGEEVGLLIASLLAITVPSAEVPALDDPAFALRVVEGIELDPGHPLSFVVQTVPVVSSDERMVSLLTFSSPNVPLAPLLGEGFAAIAATARLLPVADQ